MTKVSILDGGMSRELVRQGAHLAQPQWSALALMNEPEKVEAAHRAFILAGAKIITTNSYAIVPFHLGQETFEKRGRELAALSGQLAHKAANEANDIKIAGCLPPACGSYVPEKFHAEQAAKILNVLVDALEPHVDFWLAETMSSTQEAYEAAKAAQTHSQKPIWIAFSLEDKPSALAGATATLRSGESISAAVHCAYKANAQAILFNCSQPEVMESAIFETKRALQELATQLPIGIYANTFDGHDEEAGGANEHIHELRKDLTPEGYVAWAQKWADQGATIIGGCCGITAPHIEALAKKFS